MRVLDAQRWFARLAQKVVALLNGDEIFPAILDAIHSAQSTITYAQYFYEQGEMPEQIAAALAERCRAGIRAHVLLDGFGAFTMPASALPIP